MHKNPEFQAVVLAAGRGSRLPDVGGSVSKCLLPVGPYPVLWYSLHLLEKMGFQETMIVVLDEDNSNILNALERCPLKIKYELVVIPSDEDWGTANTLKHISSRVTADLLVISGDLITNINLNEVLNLYRKHDAALTALYFNNGPEEWIELPGPKTKAKPDRDLVCVDKETQRLVFVASASDFEDNVTLPRLLIKKFNSISMYSRLLDAHVYVMKHWVVNYLVEADKFISVKGELVPHIVKKQMTKPKNPTEKKGMSEKNIDISKDIFDYAIEHGYESQIREMSHYNDHQLGSKGVYYNDILRCYAHIADKNTFGIRVNTFSAFYLSNTKILSKWEELTGSPLSVRFHPSSEVKTRQIDETCIVGEKSVVSEKTSIKNTFMAANCTVENKVRLTNCILMNNVVIKEGNKNKIYPVTSATHHWARKNCRLYCRPIQFKFIKENEAVVLAQKSEIDKEIEDLLPTEHKTNTVKHELKMTMLDGKICTFLSKARSNATCSLCLAKPTEMNLLDQVLTKPVDTSIYQYGLSSLHARINTMECLLHIAYRQDFKQWAARGNEFKEKMASRKKIIQDRFKEEMNLLIDVVKQGSGTTNDGNTARKFFEDPCKTASITGLDEGLIRRFAVILQAVTSGEAIDVNKYKDYAHDTVRKYVELYNWYHMSATVHKLLVHGADIIAHNAVIPIGNLSEEASEARNKDFRRFREHNSQKKSRQDSNHDIINMLLLSSDPKLTAMRPTMNKKNRQTLFIETLDLLINSESQNDSELDAELQN